MPTPRVRFGRRPIRDATRRRLSPLLSALLLLTLSGCAVGVSIIDIDDGAYTTMWARDWAVVDSDAAAFAPSGGNPGACNTGGTKIGCYQASVQVATDLQSLLSDLKSTSTPSQFATANGALEHAVELDITGLNLRAQSLTAAESTSPDDATMFSQGMADIRQAASEFSTAYAEFPSYARPSPVPFAGGYAG
jgi:hypothetical protein